MNLNHAMPWWVRAFLMTSIVRGLIIGLSGLLLPATIQVPLPMSALNARFVGALYLAGTLGLVITVLARQREDARPFLFGVMVVTSLLLTVTLANWPEFTLARHMPAWLGSYIFDPIAGTLIVVSTGLWRLPSPKPHRLTRLFTFEAALFGGLGLLLMLAPSVATGIWPWSLPPLLARLYSCFFFAFAVVAWMVAREGRPATIRALIGTSLALSVLVIVGSLPHLSRFSAGLASWLWFGGLVAGVCLFLFALVQSERDRRLNTSPAPSA